MKLAFLVLSCFLCIGLGESKQQDLPSFFDTVPISIDSDADNCVRNDCGPHGSCVDEINSFSCLCEPGFTGARCDEEIDPCESEPCANDGICFRGEGSNSQSFECECTIEYEGPTCEKYVPICLRHHDLCAANATCVSFSEDHFCLCPEGYMGEYCQEKGEDIRLENMVCEENRCMNNGRCLSMDGETSCACEYGFYGDFCENVLDICFAVSCSNHGRCVSVYNTYYCVCDEGYHGWNCEHADQCAQHESLCNNGTCFDVQGDTFCFCDFFYTGRFCETPYFCSSMPCQNGGVCQNNQDLDDYECLCPKGFEGRNCEEILDPCTTATNPCLNEAQCSPDSEDSKKAVCICKDGFYGSLCEYSTEKSPSETELEELKEN